MIMKSIHLLLASINVSKEENGGQRERKGVVIGECEEGHPWFKGSKAIW